MSAAVNATRRRFGDTFIGMLTTRLVGIAVVLFVLTFVVFALMHLAPGDLVKTLLGNRPANPEAVAAIREKYQLDEPLLTQYGVWLGNVLTGNYGDSIRLQVPVAQAIGDRIPTTFWMCALAFVMSVLIAVPLGIRGAVRPRGAVDRVGSWLAVLGISAPTFAVGVLLLYVFSYYLPIFPVYGTGDGFFDMLYHLILPAFSLTVGLAAILLKLTRTAMVGALNSDYVTGMRARGIPERQVERVALRNAAMPIITAASLVLTFLVGGTLLAETTFALPGLGKLLADSVMFKDIPVVQAATLLIAALIAVIALLADIAFWLLDPRQRRSRS
ncbi:ABC transporter permease [uncultured Gulosibacter sp.]|uniref:ABC transporter permease n=1 Tax=uncultured Gulosibacter sp. TaxID=1339167 RepID=UPI002889517F|nr:ABC transporter permease [uncultured Gulosibacter sp.]